MIGAVALFIAGALFLGWGIFVSGRCEHTWGPWSPIQVRIHDDGKELLVSGQERFCLDCNKQKVEVL